MKLATIKFTETDGKNVELDLYSDEFGEYANDSGDCWTVESAIEMLKDYGMKNITYVPVWHTGFGNNMATKTIIKEETNKHLKEIEKKTTLAHGCHSRLDFALQYVCDEIIIKMNSVPYLMKNFDLSIDFCREDLKDFFQSEYSEFLDRELLNHCYNNLKSGYALYEQMFLKKYIRNKMNLNEYLKELAEREGKTNIELTKAHAADAGAVAYTHAADAGAVAYTHAADAGFEIDQKGDKQNGNL